MGGVDLLDHTLSDLRPVIWGIDGIHKCHQYCICIQLAVVSYCFWRNSTAEKSHVAHCGYHDQTIKATHHQYWFSSNKGSQSGWWSEIWWVRSLSHQLLSLEMCSFWEKLSLANSCEKWKPSLNVKTGFQIFHENLQ